MVGQTKIDQRGSADGDREAEEDREEGQSGRRDFAEGGERIAVLE